MSPPLYAIYLSRAPAFFTRGESAKGEADLRKAEALAAELHQPAFETRALSLRVASTLLSGQLAKAELMLTALSEKSERHGIPANMVPTLAFRLHYERGTLGDLEELFVMLAEDNPAVPAYRTGLLAVYVNTDRPDQALTHLRALHADDWAIVPRDGLWIVTVAGAARNAGLLGELEIAADAFELGKEHTDWLPYTGVSYEQPIAMSLGTAAAALGRIDEADALFQKAIDLSARAEAPTFVAASQAQWAESTLDHSKFADTEKVRSLASAAHATAEQLGLARVELLSQRVLDRI